MVLPVVVRSRLCAELRAGLAALVRPKPHGVLRGLEPTVHVLGNSKALGIVGDALVAVL